jgi:nucleotide-binding universal stress UspA family protein
MSKMFRHILVPTDGSEMSNRAIGYAVGLARALGARITGLHVIPEYHRFTYRTQMLLTYHAALPQDSEDAWLAATASHARSVLAVMKKAAAKAGVRCDVGYVRHDQPFRAIIDSAKAKRCDLIVMASHGRSGMQGVVLGSEAHKVLVHSHLPVLVWRPPGG